MGKAHFNTSEPHPEHVKFPYLLRKCKIERPNQVWSTDITYTAVAGHRAFVIGIVDWFSRKVLAYNVVNTMDAFHCVETLRMAVDSYGKPEIFNSSIMQKPDARRKNLLRKGSFLLALFLFQTFLNRFDSIGSPIESRQA